MPNLSTLPRANFCGDKLRLARQFHGFSLTDLSLMVDASRQYLHQLESGLKVPNGLFQDLLADVLGVEPAFFEGSLETLIKEEQAHFRKLRSTPVKLVHRVLAFGTLVEQFVSYLDTFLELPDINFQVPNVFDGVEPERAAQICRSHLGLGEGPVSNVVRLLENAGIVVTLFHGGTHKLDALSMSRRRPIIVRSTEKQSLCRMRFDLAHEYAHLLIHQSVPTGDKRTERQADLFASALLLPADAFRKEFPRSRRLDWKALFEMKLRWKVSVQAILMRAHQLQLIDNLQYRKGFIHLQNTGQRKIEKYDSRLPLEEPELINSAVSTLRKHNPLYLADVAADLQVKPVLLKKLLSFIPSVASDIESISESENVVSIHRAR